MSSTMSDLFSRAHGGVKARRFGFSDTPADAAAGGGRAPGGKQETNIGSSERAVTSMIGGGLVVSGAACAWRRPRSAAAWLSGLALAGAGGALIYRAATGHCGGYEALGVTAADAGAGAAPWNRAIHVRHSVTVQKPADELYRFWRDFSNLPRIMKHLERVEDLGGGRSRWTAKAPPTPAATDADGNVQWTARITEDRPGALIAWETEPNATVEHAGRVEFRSAGFGRGSVVRATFDYRPVGGALGALFAKVFGREPGQQVKEDLRRFKAHMEAGEFPTIQGQPRGTCS